MLQMECRHADTVGMTDPVIAALRSALSALPEQTGSDARALRLHLGSQLTNRGKPEEALAEIELILASDPADTEALALAVPIATALGDPRAPGWNAVLSALRPAVPPPPNRGSAPPAEVPPPVTTEPGEPIAVPTEGPGSDDGYDEFDEYDEFLMDAIRDDRRNRVRLSDVGGMTAVKAQLERSFFAPIRNPAMQAAYGLKATGGLMLYGPPGCGKTFLARAIAGELDANFMSLGLHEVLDMWIGSSEKQLHQLFETARGRAPTVLFFDEVDAIGQKRSAHNSSGMRNVVAQLLSEMDGVAADNDGVYFIGATNAPWDVDPALRRPGRFDRAVAVLPPDAQARAAILEYHLRDRPAEGVSVNEIAGRTAGFSGADLKLVCDSAVEVAMEKAMKSGTVEPVTQRLMVKAAKAIKPSIGPWLETARNYVTFANQDGVYDDLATYLDSKRR